MKRTTLVAVALLALVATAGTVSASPGDAAGPANQVDPGPPGGLPDVVPDFVSDILGLVGDFIAGVLDGTLGDAVSEVAGGGA